MTHADNGRHETLPRVETGPVQFEDDWRGVFIRGDDALLEFRPALRRFIAGAPRPTDYASLESLAALLGRANHHVADEGLQILRRASDKAGRARGKGVSDGVSPDAESPPARTLLFPLPPTWDRSWPATSTPAQEAVWPVVATLRLAQLNLPVTDAIACSSSTRSRRSANRWTTKTNGSGQALRDLVASSPSGGA